MSRTDKTKPWRVRRAEHDHEPIHNHGYGPCDLPDGPLDPDTDSRCYWAFTGLWRGCCSGQTTNAGRREWTAMKRTANRRERHAARVELRRLITGALDD
ncbi:hypothetical protein [Nocardiopsis coralliicola]